MKKTSLLFCTLFSLTYLTESYAQSRPRGPSYNPSRGGGSSSGSSSRPSGGSSSGSSSRGPSYNPSRGSSSGSGSSSPTYRPRPSSGSSSSGSSSSGPSYNPRPRPSTPSTPSTPRGPSYDPTPRTPTTTTPSTPRGPSYNPTPSTPSTPTATTPRGPSYNPPAPGHNPRNPIPYNRVYVGRTYAHRPHTVVIPNLVVRYTRPYNYYQTVNRYHVYRSWIYEPVPFWYTNGYWTMNDYPYYVYRGYRYRYSPVEVCNYELVDSTTNTTVKNYFDRFCDVAYNECAVDRDTANAPEQFERYFCAEKVDDEFANNDPTTFSSRPVVVAADRQTQIMSYLQENDYLDIFRDLKAGEFDKCSLVRVRGNEHGCKFILQVEGKTYPDVDGSVCSEGAQAAILGCNVGNEKSNMGCIARKAIEEGYCL